MKKILLFPAFLALIFSCEKDCNQIVSSACNDEVPIELCQAVFNRWFFNNESNSCEEISYSGCSAKGFETLEDCEQCKCDEK
jgi:hypothetical protein